LIKSHRPAGNLITLKLSHFDDRGFSPFRIKLYQSGTASLSAAILASIKLSNRSARVAEILLPAYACPDLVSAVLYARAKPVLVDLEQDSPHLSLSQVKEKITDRTVAVIAVNFLGIPEHYSQIRQICNERGLFFIVDSAQWFPITNDIQSWAGDFNIISFGRGKPVNLLSGGAVLTLQNEFYNALPDSNSEDISNIKRTLQMLKIILYNIAIQHYFYGIFTRIPGLNIGETIFKPLTVLSTMGPLHRRLIKSNIQKYQHQKSVLWEIHNKLKIISSHYLVDLLPENATEKNSVLLRYPILIKNKTIRDKFYLLTKDYGVSTLYTRPLNEISGLEKILGNQSLFPNASEFADFLVTLPTHEHVDERLIDKILAQLKQVLNQTN